ncbi:hypothetical protein C8A03DRAFT_40622 [Achaetomium macrosporum]|uniref:RING-type E3 ubiquitin transferase n=1 Tax=Achaetomium macrosporum TaxID=79813 RepID=A0AAN7HEE8_9PEZI|nr:hypothetical protein C8A03DRAFT_40622 [Achaetomium macrosporum]
MRPPRVAILVLFFSASLFLVCRAISSSRRPSPAAKRLTSQKSSFRAFFSFTAPFSLFPPSAAISLTDDNSTFFPARPAAFGPPLPNSGLSGQLWIGSGFSEESLQDGEGEGELGCSDIPGWDDGRNKLAMNAAVQGPPSKKPSPAANDRKSPSSEDLEKDPVVDLDTVRKRRSEAQPKTLNDGTDDYLHQGFQQTGSPHNEGPTASGASHADIQSIQETAEITGKVVLLSRGGCGFLEKVKWAQRRGAIALIVGDNQKGGPLIQMFARGNVDNVTIPSVFTSRTTAHLLSSLMQPGSLNRDTLEGNRNPMLNVQHSSKAGDSDKVDKKAAHTTHASKITAAATPSHDNTNVGQRGWLSRLFPSGNRQGVSPDTNRPPSSGQHGWVVADDQDGEMDKLINSGLHKAANNGAKGSANAPDEDFQIGAQDRRDPGLVGSTAESDEDPTPNQSANDNTQSSSLEASVREAGKPGNSPSADMDGPKGGRTIPGSGEYIPEVAEDPVAPGSVDSASSSPSRGLLSKIFGDGEAQHEQEGHASGDIHGSPVTMPTATPPVIDGNEAREGLWVTITPTGSASPFFDTLLVLVISPLITLTVVYALLVLRVKIRMRRWRAPKSVVDRLPVRTYHTVAPSPTQSPRSPSPTSSSPTTPLLQGSPRSRPRPRTTTGVFEAGDLLRADDSPQTARLPSRASSKWKKYMGRQVECVVCLEEYVDGVSRVMSLPCGHEFHAECITPWLTTRRRTCPICKSDVVRSLARGSSSEPLYETFREDEYGSNGGYSDTSYQARVPSPNRLIDLERGPSWTHGTRQELQHESHNDVWSSLLANNWGRSSSFSSRREGSGEGHAR